MQLEHRGQQVVLAAEVIVERALGHSGPCGDRINADARIATPIKKPIGRIDNAPACRRSIPHVYPLVNLRRDASALAVRITPSKGSGACRPPKPDWCVIILCITPTAR